MNEGMDAVAYQSNLHMDEVLSMYLEAVVDME
jgi:hypothetical protein